MKSILSVGMDVHKNSFSLCAYDGYTGEIVSESTFASDVKLVIKFIEKLKSRYENDVEIKCGYEAGCLGYSLYKSLTWVCTFRGGILTISFFYAFFH